MKKVLLLALLAAACASPPPTYSFHVDAIELGPTRDPNDPARVTTRHQVDGAAFEGARFRPEVFTQAIADGCPEGWLGVFYCMPVWGVERAEQQSKVLARLADVDPDHEWFVDHLARTWINVNAGVSANEGFAHQLRVRATYVETSLTRLATKATRPDIRAAAAGSIGRMLVYGNMQVDDGVQAVARGAELLRGALAIWNNGVKAPPSLALNEPRTPKQTQDELQELVVAATGRAPGQQLAPLSLLDERGQEVRFQDALGKRPGVVIVWGYD